MAKRKQKKRDLSLYDEYILLAMRADKRLQRLEKYAQRPGNEDLLKGAYARAMRDIRVYSGRGHKRFKTKIPLNPDTGMPDENILRAKINDIKSFLRADTSTLKPGIDTQGFSISSYEKMAKMTNDRYGTDLSWQELANYYESTKAEKIAASIKASKSVAMALSVFEKLRKQGKTNAELMRKIRKQGKESFKKNGRTYYRYKNIKLTDDVAINDIVNRMIKMGISPQTMFEGKYQ